MFVLVKVINGFLSLDSAGIMGGRTEKGLYTRLEYQDCPGLRYLELQKVPWVSALCTVSVLFHHHPWGGRRQSIGERRGWQVRA